MKKLSGSDIRTMFLEFFTSKGHYIEPSRSLIPVDDETLLWINSGVATLKKYFDGREIPPRPRIANAQKSLRTNDIENVGVTARHHTFFEMLGNFSIGDYFKEDAIAYAWEFLTSEEWIAFEKEKLYVTVHPSDQEAYNLWISMGVSKDHIVILEDNFWEIGNGPGGPNSEIFYDRGERYNVGVSEDELYPGGENDRYIEIWNIVFSQYNCQPDLLKRSEYEELPNKNIDTGMGLERMASVIQGTETNFETDLFRPYIQYIEDHSHVKYGTSSEIDTAMKIIVDHIRTLVFTITDGAIPSNDGRGYVLRRLLRRAVKVGKSLNLHENFMCELVPIVVDKMKDFYPELVDRQAFVSEVIQFEEAKFNETLKQGLERLDEYLEAMHENGEQKLSGGRVFKLYDTYGFPMELTEEIVVERGYAIDRIEFEKELERQRDRARQARHVEEGMKEQDTFYREINTQSAFVGYDMLSVHTEIVLLIQENTIVSTIEKGEAHVLVAECPFYAESGGQESDGGVLAGMPVQRIQKLPNGQHLITVHVEETPLHVGMIVEAHVDEQRRFNLSKNHSAVHLLHEALCEVLGDTVSQAGSFKTEAYFRFDFTTLRMLTRDQLQYVEDRVNEMIMKNLNVRTEEMPLQVAKDRGAHAQFTEKYGDVVRVVTIGDDYSIELCGGTHVQYTSQIGIVKLLSESGIGSGTRRIVGTTMQYARQAYQKEEEKLMMLEEHFKIKQRDNLVPALFKRFAELEEIEKNFESFNNEIMGMTAPRILDEATTINDIRVVIHYANLIKKEQLKILADDFKQIPNTLAFIMTQDEEKAVLITTSSIADYEAGRAMKKITQELGGRGGGKKDFAQGGAEFEKTRKYMQELSHETLLSYFK